MTFLMKQFMRLGILMVFILLLILDSCKKKEPEKIYIPEEVKQFTVFQSGSYWIYRNESKGELDSCFINESPNFMYEDLTNLGANLWETFNIQYHGSLIIESWYMFDQYHMGFSLNNDVMCLSGSSLVPGYSIKLEESKLFKNIGIIDTLIIYNTKYYNVFNTEYDQISKAGDTVKFLCYFEKNIGLIKFVNRNKGEELVWNLVRYKSNN